mgnify:CR=1 FL=1
MNLKLPLIFVVLFWGLVANLAAANDRIVIVTEIWPPFNFINEEGKVDGIATNVVKRVMELAEIDYHIEVYPWKRAYMMAKENKNVLLYTIYRIESREKHFQWICPLVNTGGVGLYTLATRNDIKIEVLDDAKTFVTGVVGSGVTHDFLKFNGFVVGRHLDIGTDDYANIRKLIGGRVDLIVQEETPFDMRLKEEGLDRQAVKKVFTLLGSEKRVACMAMSLDTPKALVSRITSALKQIKH